MVMGTGIFYIVQAASSLSSLLETSFFVLSVKRKFGYLGYLIMFLHQVLEFDGYKPKCTPTIMSIYLLCAGGVRV